MHKNKRIAKRKTNHDYVLMIVTTHHTLLTKNELPRHYTNRKYNVHLPIAISGNEHPAYQRNKYVGETIHKENHIEVPLKIIAFFLHPIFEL